MEATTNWNEQVKAQLINKGLIEVEGMKFHSIEGGFGEGKKSMLVKEVAFIHDKEFKHVNEAVNKNRKRFVNSIDIIDLKSVDLIDRDFLNQIGFSNSSIANANNIYILSERGYSKLLKILEDDFAWEQYDKLVDGYFNMRKEIQKPSCVEDILIQSLQEIKQVKEQANQANHHALEAKDEISSFKKQYKEDRENDPLFDIEREDLQKVVKRVSTNILGGHGSPAYLDKSISGKVFADVQRQIKREFGLRSYKAIKRCQLELAINIVEGYKAPFVLQQEIDCLNNQLSI